MSLSAQAAKSARSTAALDKPAGGARRGRNRVIEYRGRWPGVGGRGEICCVSNQMREIAKRSGHPAWRVRATHDVAHGPSAPVRIRPATDFDGPGPSDFDLTESIAKTL